MLINYGRVYKKDWHILTRMEALVAVRPQQRPAEGIFSILAYITENRASLTPGHLSKLCRVVKEGPTPGTLKAANLTKRALGKWPSEYGTRFTTNNYMFGMTSSTVADVMNSK